MTTHRRGRGERARARSARRRSRRPPAWSPGRSCATMGTLGGNVMLDTRCQWYNQTYFWRKALGFCLKKDGTLCHVVEGGQKCVAAASQRHGAGADDARRDRSRSPAPTRRTAARSPIDDFWTSDGIYNKKLAPRRDPGRRAHPAHRRGPPRRLRQAARPRLDRLPAARRRRAPRARPAGRRQRRRPRAHRPRRQAQAHRASGQDARRQHPGRAFVHPGRRGARRARRASSASRSRTSPATTSTATRWCRSTCAARSWPPPTEADPCTTCEP